MIAALKDFIGWLGADASRLVALLVLAWAMSCVGNSCHVTVTLNAVDGGAAQAAKK